MMNPSLTYFSCLFFLLFPHSFFYFNRHVVETAVHAIGRCSLPANSTIIQSLIQYVKTSHESEIRISVISALGNQEFQSHPEIISFFSELLLSDWDM